MTVAKKIRLLRQRKGLSQEEVALKLGISVPALSKIETGTTDVNISRIEQIAALFGVTLMALLQWDGEGQPGSNEEIESLSQKLINRDAQVIELQKQIIRLMEALKD
jgi:transcriptional regulator with XRE-family HTH domain